MALEVAQRYPEVEIVINDADQRVAAFWSVMADRSEAPFAKLLTQVKSVVPTVETWTTEKRAGMEGSRDELAFRALFLNRCTFSGNMSLSAGGPIGGYDQTGKWKIDARWKLELLVPNLEALRQLFVEREVRVTSLPWEQAVGQPGNYYYDPPYTTVSAKALYASAFSVDDHIALRNHLRVSEYPWVLSYDKDPQGHIAWLYEFAAWEHVEHSSRVQAGAPEARIELLYWSRGRN